jgi:hypothetical protein
MQRRPAKTLAMLGFILLLIVFSSTLKGWLGSLFRPKVVRLENTEIVIPKGWLVSQEPAKVFTWKPCWTIFCGLPSRASFTIKVSGLPAAAWENATKKILEEDFSTDTTVETFSGNSGPFTCGRSGCRPRKAESRDGLSDLQSGAQLNIRRRSVFERGLSRCSEIGSAGSLI